MNSKHSHASPYTIHITPNTSGYQVTCHLSHRNKKITHNNTCNTIVPKRHTISKGSTISKGGHTSKVDTASKDEAVPKNSFPQ